MKNKFIAVFTLIMLLFNTLPFTMGVSAEMAEGNVYLETYAFTGDTLNGIYFKNNNKNTGWYIRGNDLGIDSTDYDEDEINIVKSPEDNGNDVLRLYKGKNSSTANTNYFRYDFNGKKEFGDGGIYSLKFKMRSSGLKTATMVIGCNTKAVTYNKFVTDCGSAMNDDTWHNVEYVFDFSGEKCKYSIYIDGSKIAVANNEISKGSIDSGKEYCRIQIQFDKLGTGCVNSGADYACLYLDDVSFSDVLKPEIKSNEAGDLNKAVIDFKNCMVQGISGTSLVPLAKENIFIENNEGNFINPIAVNHQVDTNKYEITLASPLSPETEYDVQFDNIVYDYGVEELTQYSRRENKLRTSTYRTRDKRISVDNAKFYTDYGITGSQAESATLVVNKDITAAFYVDNELAENYTGDVILVHKKDGVVKNAKITPNVTVNGEDDGDIAATLSALSEVTADDKLEAYLWSDFAGGYALKEFSSINNAGIVPEGGFSKAATHTAVTASLALNPIDDIGTVSGQLKGAENTNAAEQAEITVLALKSDKELSHLTNETAFNDYVVGIAQTSTNPDGSYAVDFKLNMQSGEDTFNVYVTTKNASATDSAFCYSRAAYSEAMGIFNNDPVTELKKYLGDTKMPTSDLFVKDVLNLNLTDYNALEDKDTVCSNVIGKGYTDPILLKSDFEAEVAKQKYIEDTTAARVAAIDVAAWDEIEQLLIDDRDIVDVNNNKKNYLALNWTGDYATVAANSDWKTAFYKRLAADYTFTKVTDLRTAFASLATDIVTNPPIVQTEDTTPEYTGGYSYSGGGGGGSMTPKPAETVQPVVDTNAAVNGFNDLASVPWAQEAIDALAKDGIINGVGGGSFAPNDSVTREQLIKMAVLAFGLTAENTDEMQFTDVAEGTWYEEYVKIALAEGIIYGVDDLHFGVGKVVTRAEMATILYRCALKAGLEMNVNAETVYADNGTIPAYALDGVYAMSNMGIINGVGDNNFDAYGNTTRAMIAKVIYLLRGAM